MPKYFLSLLLPWIVSNTFSQNKPNQPLEIMYNNCRILSESQTDDTIAGVSVRFTTTTVEAAQYIQTFCSYSNSSHNRFDSVHVIATISYVKDSSEILKTAIYNDFLFKIDRAEKYAASNNYKASVVPERYFYRIDSLFVPGIRMLNSSEGNYVIWYINGCVYKITLIEDNNMGNLNALLRENIRLGLNGKLLDADDQIMGIAEIKRLLQVWK